MCDVQGNIKKFTAYLNALTLEVKLGPDKYRRLKVRKVRSTLTQGDIVGMYYNAYVRVQKIPKDELLINMISDDILDFHNRKGFEIDCGLESPMYILDYHEKQGYLYIFYNPYI